MTKRERVLAAIRREPTDRTPYAFWRHFPAVDRSPAALSQSTLRFHERYGSDFLKVTPAGGYAVEDWGCVESEEPAPDGHRPCASHAVNAPDDWKKIRPVPMESTGWASHVESVIRCVVDRRADCSVVPTVFSPLSLARKAITETILAFMEACFREGAEGIFYSVQAASHAFHTEDEYARFGEPHDRRILEAVREGSRLTVLHCHGERLMFDRLAALPADVWNWDDRRAGPSLSEGKDMVPGAVQGGLNQWSTLKDGTGPDAQAEAQDAIAQTSGTGIILGAGCVLLTQHSDATLIDLIQSVGGSVKLMGIKPQ